MIVVIIFDDKVEEVLIFDDKVEEVLMFDDKVEEVLLAQQDEQNGFGEKLNAEARVEVAFHFFALSSILCIHLLKCNLLHIFEFLYF